MTEPEKKISLGDPLPLSDVDLDELTTAEETKKAKDRGDKLWRKANPDLAVLDAIDEGG